MRDIVNSVVGQSSSSVIDGSVSRKNPRYRLRNEQNWSISLNGRAISSLRIKDVSPWGTKIQLPIAEAAKVGDLVSVVFFHKEEFQFCAKGIVRWRAVGKFGVEIGIEFRSGSRDVFPSWKANDIFEYMSVDYEPQTAAPKQIVPVRQSRKNDENRLPVAA